MNLDICEFMDCWTEGEYSLRDSGGASAERIKELSMKKIKALPRARRLPVRLIAIAAACIAALSITAAAVAENWGYKNTSELSDAEIRQLLEEAAIGHYTQSVDPDGTVHYLYDGEVQFTLSRWQAAKYEAEIRAARRQAVRNSTDKLDVDTMELFPKSVTEMSVDAEGGFDDFMLHNGHVVLLCDTDGECFSLKAGDEVTIELLSSSECHFSFGMALDGKIIESHSIKAQELSHSFTVPANGEYCFTLGYYSTDADNFTDCRLTINGQ